MYLKSCSNDSKSKQFGTFELVLTGIINFAILKKRPGIKSNKQKHNITKNGYY